MWVAFCLPKRLSRRRQAHPSDTTQTQSMQKAMRATREKDRVVWEKTDRNFQTKSAADVADEEAGEAADVAEDERECDESDLGSDLIHHPLFQSLRRLQEARSERFHS